MDHSCPSRPKAMNWNEMRAPKTWVRVCVYQIGQAAPLRINVGEMIVGISRIHKALFLGPERAPRIDPARSALQRGMRFTLHHDAPVAGIDMLAVISVAVNRRTTGGDVLGEDQKISAADALRAVTIDAAWQYFEEDGKGSTEPGKLADMVILSTNPLEVDPKTIGDIQVLETIKEGVSVYTHKS